MAIENCYRISSSSLRRFTPDQRHIIRTLATSDFLGHMYAKSLYIPLDLVDEFFGVLNCLYDIYY